MPSKTRLLANLITSTGDVKSTSLDNASGGGGATSYANAAALPTSGNTAGDLAFTLDKKALFNWDGNEWDRVYSGPNETLTWDSALPASTGLVLDGSKQVIHVAAAADAEGFPVEYNFSLSPSAPVQLDSSFSVIDSENGNFTIKPTTTVSRAGTFQFRATATDGTHVISTTTTAQLAFRFIAEGVEASSAMITIGAETWRYHVFDSSSTFTVTQDIDSAEYILIGGGGDGGTNGGGGGGAGGFAKGSAALTAGNYAYTIGAAGVYASASAGSDTMASAWNGENSTLTGTGVSLTAYGGGGGGLRTGTNPYIEARGQAGGSSGGNGGGNNTSSNPYAPLASGAQGNAGGDDGSSDTNAAGGGGGGAGGAGTAGGYRAGGNGGPGIQDNFTGTLTYYCAGGSGGVVVNGTGGSPGTGHDSAGYGMGGDGTGGNTQQKATQGVLMIRYKLAG